MSTTADWYRCFPNTCKPIKQFRLHKSIRSSHCRKLFRFTSWNCFPEQSSSWQCQWSTTHTVGFRYPARESRSGKSTSFGFQRMQSQTRSWNSNRSSWPTWNSELRYQCRQRKTFAEECNSSNLWKTQPHYSWHFGPRCTSTARGCLASPVLLRCMKTEQSNCPLNLRSIARLQLSHRCFWSKPRQTRMNLAGKGSRCLHPTKCWEQDYQSLIKSS